MKVLTILSFAALAISSQATSVKSYEGYKTFRIFPENEFQLTLLAKLEQDYDYDFWTMSRLVGQPVDVMVSPDQLEFFENFMKNFAFNYEVLIENVADTITKEPEVSSRFADPNEPRISFEKFERYDSIVNYMKDLAKKYSHVSLFSIGKTYEGRDHYGVKISSGGNNKPAILIDAGIHAREWMAPATGLYIINQLAENANVANLYKKVDWYIVPVLNPDGYEYTHTTARLWRKTRSKGKKCVGVDPNRNFGFHWNEVGTSNNECSDIYAGPSAFSEIETRNLRDFAKTIKNLKLYLTFHAYGNYILYPWGYTSNYPSNRWELDDLAQDVNAAIRAVRGTTYTIGSSTNVLYPAAGGSDDFMMGVLGVPLSYTIEMPGGGPQGFDPPARDILPCVTEMFEGIKVYAKYVETK